MNKLKIMFLCKFLFISIYQPAGSLLCDISQNVLLLTGAILCHDSMRTPKVGLIQQPVRFFAQLLVTFFLSF